MTEHVTFPDLPETLTRAVEDEDRAVMKNVLTPRGLKRRRVLIVGGAGYIGIPLTQHLLEQGFDVRVLDLLLYENPATCATARPGTRPLTGSATSSFWPGWSAIRSPRPIRKNTKPSTRTA